MSIKPKAVETKKHAKLDQRKLIKFTKFQQYKTLLSPVRFEIFEAMRFIAPCSVAELADYLDRPADGLYLHLRKLESIGVIRPASFRKNGKHIEQVYDLAGDDVDFQSLRPPMADKVIAEVNKLFLSVSKRGLRDAIDAGAINYEPSERNLIILNYIARLTKQDRDRIAVLTREIVEIIEQARTNRDGELFLWLTMLCPQVRTRHARSRNGDA